MMIPLNEYIVVKVDETSVAKEKDGFIVPDTAKKKPYIGTVLEVSEKIKGIIQTGDKVVWPSTLGVETEIENQKVVILKLEDILMKLK